MQNKTEIAQRCFKIESEKDAGSETLGQTERLMNRKLVDEHESSYLTFERSCINNLVQVDSMLASRYDRGTELEYGIRQDHSREAVVRATRLIIKLTKPCS